MSKDDLQARLERLLRAAWGEGGAVHLVAGQPPRLRGADGLAPIPGEPAWSAADLAAVAREHLGPRLERAATHGRASCTLRVSRDLFGRLTWATNLGEPSLSIRLRAAGEAPSLETLHAPKVLDDLLDAPHGLLVVAGPHASGKTTTVYAMVDAINRRHAVHICTVEDPVGLELMSRVALVQQREVGTDVPDVAAGVAAAMDQDVDVLAVTALDDLADLSTVLHAAETGHLVLLQVHADDARAALERLVEATPRSLQPGVRRTLAATLRGVVAQRLVPKLPRGRLAVYEVLLPGDALRAALRDSKALAEVAGAPGSIGIVEDAERHVAAGRVHPHDVVPLRGGWR